ILSNRTVRHYRRMFEDRPGYSAVHDRRLQSRGNSRSQSCWFRKEEFYTRKCQADQGSLPTDLSFELQHPPSDRRDPKGIASDRRDHANPRVYRTKPARNYSEGRYFAVAASRGNARLSSRNSTAARHTRCARPPQAAPPLLAAVRA